MKQAQYKGILFGISSGIFWGADTAFNALVLTMVPFTLDHPYLLSATLLMAFFHDFFSALILTGQLVLTRNISSMRVALKSRSALFVMLAALFAGPLGMQAYLYAVQTIGSGLTATISAMYPAVAAILGAVFLKDVLHKKGWVGLLLTIIAIMIIGYTNDMSANLLGIIAAFLCVVGWASESVICAYGMKEDISPKEALCIRQWTSSITYLLILLISGHFWFNISAVLSSPSVLWVVALALVGTLSYLCYYSAIDSIGPVKATGLNVTYAVWTMIFSVIFLHAQFDYKLILCSVLIIIGSYLVVQNQM